MSQAVEIIFRGNAAGAVAASRQTQAAISGLDRPLRGMTGTFSRFSGLMRTVLGTAGLVGVGAGLVKAGQAAVGFDRGMRNVNSIAQLSEGQLKALEKQVLALAGPTAQAPEALAAGLYDVVSSGFEAGDAVEVVAASAKAATAGLTDTATATKAITAVLNAYHLGAGEAADVSDVLFQTVNKGVLTFEELASQIGEVLPYSSQLGVKLEEVGGAMATMTLQGNNAALSSTQLKSLLVQMISPAEELKTAINELGYETGSALLDEKGLVGAIRLLDEAAKGNKETLAKWFPEVRSLSGFLSLAGSNMRTFEQTTRSMDEASRGAGATTKAFAEQSKSLSFQWQKAKASLAAAAIPIAQLLFPALTRGAGAVADFAGKVSQHTPEIRARFGEIAGVIGDVASALFKFGTSAGGTSLIAMLGTMWGMHRALNMVRGAVAALMGLGLGGWAGAAVAVVGLLAGAFTFLSQQGRLSERALRAVKVALDDLRGAAETTAVAESTYQAALSRRENAELNVRQAVRDRHRVEVQVKEGTLKGKDAELALAAAMQRVKDAYRERTEARKQESKAAQELADAQNAEQDQVEQTRGEMEKTGKTVRDLQTDYEKLTKVLREGKFAPKFGVTGDIGMRLHDWKEAMAEVAREAEKIAKDSQFTERSRRNAASLRDQAAAALILADELGRVPTDVEVKTKLLDREFRQRVRDAIARLVELEKKKPHPRVTLPGAEGVLDKLARIEAGMAGLGDKTITITTRYQSIGSLHRAAGGIIPGSPGAGDSVPALLTPGEMVLNEGQQRALGGQAYLARKFGFAGGGIVRRFAAGGVAAGGAPTTGGGGGSVSGLLAELERVARAIRDVGRAGDDASTRLGRAFEAMENKIKRLAPEGGKAAEKLTAALDRVKAKVDRLKSAFASAFEAFQGRALEAFDRLTEGHLTPAEQQLRDMQDAHEAQQRAREMADAQAELQAAETEEEKRAARLRIAELMYDDQVRALEAQAALERREYEDQRANQREHMERQLEQLQAALERGELTHKLYQQRLRALLKRHGIDLRTAGALIGDQFVKGLGQSLRAVEKFADAIARAVRNLINASGGGGSGGGTPGHARGGVTRTPWAIVGEQGPELARFPLGTRITPAGETRRLIDAMLRPAALPATAGGVYQRGGDTNVVYNVTVRVAGSVATERDIAQNVRKHLERISLNGGRMRFQ